MTKVSSQEFDSAAEASAGAETQTQEECLTPEGSQAPTLPIIPRVWGQLVPITTHLDLIDLYRTRVLLGRTMECDIMVHTKNYPSTLIANVSKKHFEILREDDHAPIFIKDLSKNGTFINGQLIGKNRMNILMNEDLIAIGSPRLNVYRYRSFFVNLELPIELRQKYCLTKILGIGGCGEVHLAYEKVSCKQYAVKKIRKGNYRSDSTHHLNHPSKIKVEIKILESLNHPFIINVKEIIDSETDVFIVLEYMEGGELRKRIDSLSEADAKFIFYQLISGVNHLHNQGIIHRDLKPDNILMTANSNQCIVKITDFGLSKIIDEQQLMKTICGTPQYVAPEIFSRVPYNQKVDVWSLGVILYQMIFKTLPFEMENKRPKFREQINWGSSKQLVSGVVKDLIRKMLRFNPNERISVKEILLHPWINQDVAMQHRVHALLANDGSLHSDISDDECDVSAVPSKRLKFSHNSGDTASSSFTFT